MRIQNNIDFINEVKTFYKRQANNMGLDQLSLDDFEQLIIFLVETKKNSKENFLALLRYFRFTGNRELEAAILELIDGSDVLENLSKTLKKTKGTQIHNKIFVGIDFPPLGTFSKEKPEITKKIMERIYAELGEEGCKEVLLSGPHVVPGDFFIEDKKKFLKSKNLDDFLRKRHVAYIDELEQHLKNGTLYFTQYVDQAVVDYVRDNQSCQVGLRKDDKIFVTKIPYNAISYLKEKDGKLKRYYYCHCPWVREGIKSDTKVPSTFCYCSAAFEKRLWDVIFGESVKIDVIDSVLRGDMVCRFAIHVPKKWLTHTK